VQSERISLRRHLEHQIAYLINLEHAAVAANEFQLTTP
jgi:hypothetical protein